MPDNQPTTENLLASLASAADAARQAYLTAAAANPGADLSQLYLKEMAALAAYSDAEDKALDATDPNIGKAQGNLDAATQMIRKELSTITNLSSWLTILDNLVNLAATVSKFFV